MNDLRIAYALLAVVTASSSAACSGTTVGTGSPLGSSGSSGQSTEASPNTPAEGTDGSPTTSDSEYDALFGRPATTALTPGSLTGVWAARMETSDDDLRIKIGASSITIAIACSRGYGAGSTSVVGMEVGAVVSAGSIRLVESKSVAGRCPLSVRPITYEACNDYNEICFRVSGTNLSFYGSPLFTSDGERPQGPFMKVSD